MKTNTNVSFCLFALASLGFLISLCPSVLAQGKESHQNAATDSVIFTMELHGAHCENIIHKRTPFQKGVIKVKADAGTQTVKVLFQTNKTDVGKLMEHFKKIGFDAKPIRNHPEAIQ